MTNNHGTLAVAGKGELRVRAGSVLLVEHLACAHTTGQAQAVVVVCRVVVLYTDDIPFARVKAALKGWTDGLTKVAELKRTLRVDQDVWLASAGLACEDSEQLRGRRAGGSGRRVGVVHFGNTWRVGILWCVTTVRCTVILKTGTELVDALLGSWKVSNDAAVAVLCVSCWVG